MYIFDCTSTTCITRDINLVNGFCYIERMFGFRDRQCRSNRNFITSEKSYVARLVSSFLTHTQRMDRVDIIWGHSRVYWFCVLSSLSSITVFKTLRICVKCVYARDLVIASCVLLMGLSARAWAGNNTKNRLPNLSVLFGGFCFVWVCCRSIFAIVYMTCCIPQSGGV